MSKRRTPKMNKVIGQPKTGSAVAVAARFHSGAGVHADQRRRADSKALRRDKSYKNDY